jgi:hypothetical protein
VFSLAQREGWRRTQDGTAAARSAFNNDEHIEAIAHRSAAASLHDCCRFAPLGEASPGGHVTRGPHPDPAAGS